MRIGMFTVSAVAPPYSKEKEQEAIRRDLELIVRADELGFSSAWVPEHHFTEEYSHSSAGLVMLTAAAMRTDSIRLVTGIMNLCASINHPIRIAEQMALLDVLSNGRAELGTGRGAGSAEVEPFGVDPAESKAMWAEAISAIPQMWTNDKFSFEGKYFSIPERNVLPKPVQSPHPPLWVTGTNPSTAAEAGRRGIGLAVFSFGDPEGLGEVIKAYKAEAANPAEPVSEVINNRVATIAPLLCFDDSERARELFRTADVDRAPHQATIFDSIPANKARHADEAHPWTQSQIREWTADASADPEIMGKWADKRPTVEEMLDLGCCVGNPDEVLAVIERYREAGVDDLVLVPRKGFEPWDDVFESVETFGKEVLPRISQS